jgi:hypothetical protein
MVPDFRLTSAHSETLFLQRLPRATQKAFLACTELPLLAKDGWYLAGGTSLALQAGHRKSVDLDFFTTESQFVEDRVERTLLETQHWTTQYQQRGTLYGLFHKAKMSLIAYPFFKPSGDWLSCGTVRLLKPDDVAVMKIIAISQRGRKRDFVDLYWYLLIFKGSPSRGHLFLRDLLLRTLQQYPSQKNNLPHFLKSLTFFDDAASDPMPTLYFKASWSEVKAYFRKEVPRVARELLGI